jgi:hypothetical protein
VKPATTISMNRACSGASGASSKQMRQYEG